MDIFKRLNVEEKLTVVMVTHEEDFMSYADKVVRINDGVIVELHAQGNKAGAKSKVKAQKSAAVEEVSQPEVAKKEVVVTEAPRAQETHSTPETVVAPVKKVRKTTKKVATSQEVIQEVVG
jgi:ABC-type multidrug transport system ATPase subunit